MTSLAHQLKRLALPQSDGDLLTRRDVASVLFDPKDAAAMDRSTFYALGCTGLEELLGIEPAFLEFQDTLFSPASVTLERSVQSREVNDKLDAGISLFLTRLCPYFLLKPALKCLEWLVHRFHVHLYNVDSLLACSLPYHDTNVFVRVLQLLKIRDGTNRWNWLHSLQKPGVPLSRAVLVVHCYSDLSFMDFICSLVTRSIQAFSGHSTSFSQLRIIFSFFASTIVAALDSAENVSDAVIAKLLPYVQKGLRSPLPDYRAAGYMLVCQLAVKVVLEPELVERLALQLSKSLVRDPVLAQEGLGCLTVLLQNQRDGAAGPRAAAQLSSVPVLSSTLRAMAVTHDVGPLLRYLLPHLVRAGFSGEEENWAVLESVLSSVPLPKDLDRTLARLILVGYLGLTDRSPQDLEALDPLLLPLVRLLESRYPGSLDDVLAGHVTDLSDPQQKRLFHHFLSLSTGGGKHQILEDLDTSLLLSLKHPRASIRRAALDRLVEAAPSGQLGLDRDFLKEAVAERLQDDVPEVVLAALRVLQVLLDGEDGVDGVDSVDGEDSVSWLLSLLLRADASDPQRWRPVLEETVRSLSHPRLGKADGELLQKTGWRLLPFLVVTSTQTQLARDLAHSPLLTRHPLTRNWAQELDKVMKRSSEPDFVGSANQRLVSTLAGNLAHMEHFAKREALEQLAGLVQQRGSGLRDRASFLVLVQTLLQSLTQLSETEHLLTAQRVYAALEPPLLEAAGTPRTQEAEPAVSVPPSFSEAVTAYLLRCEGQTGPVDPGDPDYTRVLMALLQDFISSLRCPSTAFRGEAWWNPEKLDSNTCCYLGLLGRVFGLVLEGSAEGPASRGFRDLMKLLVQVHLPEPASVFSFLSLLWGYGGNHGDQLDLKVGVVLQTRALYMGGALLSSQTPAALEKLIAAESPVVPSLLCCLSSTVREVRRAALAALGSLSGASGSPFQPITERLLKTGEEISTDPAYLSTALGVLHDESSCSKPSAAQRKLQAALQQLLRCVQSRSCPSYSSAALLDALGLVSGTSVLALLLPVLERLLEQTGPDTPPLLRAETRLLRLVLRKYEEASAPLLVQDRTCLDLLVRALRLPGLQLLALEQITKPFFSAIGDDVVQQKLLSVMFDLLDGAGPAAAANAVGGVFKAIAVDAQLVANELAPPQKPSVSVTVQQTRRSRMSRRRPQEDSGAGPEGGTGPDSGTGPDAGPGPDGDGGTVPWQRVTLVLELLQHKKKLKRAQRLVPVLFSLLARSLEPRAARHHNMEYTKQLLLSCLLNICTRLEGEAGVLDEERFSVELVVQCIRGSEVPQTHHQALLLLGAAASIFPEKVLHSIMPIFTFMGANILRLDDSYSFRVIDRTVQTVIPALIKAQPSPSSSQVVAVATRIMQVFVDALPHVPDHRRLALLTRLVSTLGPAHFLWVMQLLLLRLHATQSSAPATQSSAPAGDRDEAQERNAEFWVTLSCQFGVGEQLGSLVDVLKFLQQLPDDKDDAKRPAGRTAARKKPGDVEKLDELIFSVEAHSSKELRHFKFLCVSFMSQLLKSSSFVQKVADGGEDVEASLQPLQQRLLEEVLRYIHSVARCVEKNADQPTAKFWRALLKQSYDVLDKVNALLPADSFITVIRGLMGNQLPSVRRKAMELLNNKLHHRTQWDEQQVTALLQLTGDLLAVVGKSPANVGAAEEAEQAVNRQTALYSLKLLCRSFGAGHQEAFRPVLLRAVEVVVATEEDKHVLGSALLCIAEVVGALKALAIPHLPRLMPAVLHALSSRKEAGPGDVYLLSAVAALQRVAEALPHFISPYLQDVALQVCHLTLLVQNSSSSSSSQLPVRLASLRKTLATQLPPRVLLPTLTRCYSSMVAGRKDQLGALMSLLKDHINHMEKETLNVHQSELTTFFLTALDYRAQHGQVDLPRTWEVEGDVIDCLIAMVMKLSEVTFRPLFFKLFDWSKPEQPDRPDRRLTFVRLCDRVAERLKGLFVLFAGNLVQPFSEVLKQTSGADADGLFGGSVELSSLLLQLVLDCLCKLFLYDTQRFLSRDRAQVLLGPLVEQLENRLGGEQRYRDRVTHNLVPCLGQFSAALADESLWKNLNYQVLLKTRHADAKVRFSALLVLTELASKLKENYVVLLPETIPFLAELMEDECEEVEQQVQRVVQDMENILGEPLQSYF